MRTDPPAAAARVRAKGRDVVTHPVEAAHKSSSAPGATHQHTDLLVGPVLQSLMRTYPYLSWGVPKSFVLGGLTLGAAPLLLLPLRFKQHAACEREQWWHLAHWLRVRLGSQTDQLIRRVDAIDAPSRVFSMLSHACLIVAVIAAARFIHVAGIGWTHLAGLGYGDRVVRDLVATEPFMQAALLWSGFVSLGFVFHWLGVQVHRTRVRRAVREFNELGRTAGFAAVPDVKSSLGVRPLWLVGGIVLASLGALWGIPMMLAAGAHRRYIRHASPELRQSVAERVRTMVTLHRPLMTIRIPELLRESCLNENCRTPLPVPAAYCPRCGARATRLVGQVA